MTTALIVNRASAGGLADSVVSNIARALGRHISGVTVHFTEASGSATAATRAFLSDGVERVIAVGGDGTLNEVLNGFFSPAGTLISDVPLGFIPAGSGCDFARSLHLSSEPASAVNQVAHATETRIDVGEIRFGAGAIRRFFINVADCGIGGEVVRRVNANPHKGRGVRGSAVFLGTSVTELLRFIRRPVRIRCDGEALEALVQSVVFANGEYFGGGMHIAPDASLSDGLLDVLVLEVGRPRALWSLPKLYRGRHLSTPGVQLIRCREVEIEPLSHQPLRFDIDGEDFGEAPARITCRPRAIKFLVPATA